MQVLYDEDKASHDGRGSCADAREGGGEALTGVHAGRVSSREMLMVQGADAVETGGRQHGTGVMASTGPALRGPRPLARTQATCKGTGISTGWPPGKVQPGRPASERSIRKPMMHGQGKSDSSIIPAKSSNNAAPAAAETMEGRGGTKGNALRGSTCQTQSWESVSLALGRIRETARRDERVRFTALLHHVTVDLLHWSFHQLERHAAAGVDGFTWDQYEDGLEGNLIDLCARVHSGAYRAKPSRRQYIPKPDGRQRPLGIASLEDKIVQRAVTEILNAIYETDFLGFSYGFRPKRSQHDALDALATAIYRKKVNWILDADIQAFFDTVNWEWLVRFLERRIADRRLLRLIGKWLKAGVLEDGRLLTVERGTPQGAMISPVLANVHLHYVYDLWVHQWRRQNDTGEVIVVRYADDTVVGFQRRSDAERFLNDLRERLKKFGLALYLKRVMNGFLNYFAVPTNSRAINAFY